ncbi:hypothetical protein TruAng_011700 [Truncatella angustata]|nr:hypothetical protein TruAng_011700 [Truncatella angustata]
MDLPSNVVGRVNPTRRIWKHIPSTDTLPETPLQTDTEVVTGMPKSLLDIFANLGDEIGTETESRFWDWQAPQNRHPQHHCWNTWRYAGILDLRRRQKLSRPKDTLCVDEQAGYQFHSVPASEAIYARLMVDLEAVYRNFMSTQTSLEISLLKTNSLWQKLLYDFRVSVFQNFGLKTVDKLNELLDQAWQSGSDTFDIDQAAQKQGIEIALL